MAIESSLMHKLCPVSKKNIIIMRIEINEKLRIS